MSLTPQSPATVPQKENDNRVCRTFLENGIEIIKYDLSKGYAVPPHCTRLCHVCLDLDRHDIERAGEGFGRRLLLEDMERAATKGCASCSMLLAGFDGVIEWREKFATVFISTTREDRAPLWTQLSTDKFWDSEQMNIEFYTHMEEPAPWPIIGCAGSVSRDASSDECIRLVLNWIKQCTSSLSGHSKCGGIREGPLPTRVLDVGCDGEDPHLYCAKHEKCKYVALSYCWGDKAPISTTAKTLESKTHGIPLNTLPKTFRDAIKITRLLGVRYLWIDALCIIQDCKQDWEHESMRMKDVYANSFVTIAADAASDTSEGFLITGGRQVECSAVRCKGLDGCETTIYAREEKKEHSEYQHPIINGYFCKAQLGHTLNAKRPVSRLSTRAWVLQERVLAPRTLHYTEEELVWECQSRVSCECKPEVEQPEPSLVKAVLTEVRWMGVVSMCTERNLTYKTDRLPAISGLAAVRQEMFPDRYLCGMWRRDLNKQLLWSVTARLEGSRWVSRRLLPYYAPTWSWASVTGKVWSYDEEESITVSFHIVDCVSEPRFNQYGPVKSATLTVVGPVVPVRVQADLSEDPGSDPFTNGGNGLKIVSQRKSGDLAPPILNFHSDVRGMLPEVSSEATYYFLIMSDGTKSTSGILLKKESRSEGTVYFRVGKVDSFFHGKIDRHRTLVEELESRGVLTGQESLLHAIDDPAYRQSYNPWKLWTSVANAETLVIM